MTYFEGFILAVPEDKKDAYISHANTMTPMLKDCGVRRMVENWENDVPEGELTDFRKAVDARPGEKIVFAWFEYPSKQERDAANAKMMSDSRMAEMGADMPFDGKRMIMGGFDAIIEEGSTGGGYTDGFIVPVPEGRRDEYRELSSKMAETFRENGACRVVETFGDDVPKGQVTDFYRAVKAEDGEGIVFSFVEWPDKQTRDQAWGKIMAGERPRPLPYDGKRLFWGGFDKFLDTAEQQPAQQAPAPATA